MSVSTPYSETVGDVSIDKDLLDQTRPDSSEVFSARPQLFGLPGSPPDCPILARILLKPSQAESHAFDL